jgi:predicted anti-sigma-YlaC factor YlaD
VSRITDELSRLDGRELEEEERLQERQRELAEVQARLSESLARLSRLKKQKRFLQEKGVKLVNEGLAEEERIRTSEVVQEVVSAESAVSAVDPVLGDFDWNSVDVGNAVVDWSGFLNVPGVGGEGGDATVGGPSKS